MTFLNTIRRRTRLRLDWVLPLWHRYNRPLVIGATVAGAAGMGVLAVLLSKQQRIPEVVLAVVAAAPLGVFGLQFVLNRRPLIPLIVLILAAFVPVALPTGTGSTLVDSLLATVLFSGIWVLHMIYTRHYEVLPSSINVPFYFFAGVTLWSIGWSTLFRDPLVWVPRTFIIVQTASGVVNIMLPAAALLVHNFTPHVRWLKWLTGIMLVAGVVGLIPRYEIFNLPINTGGLFNMWIMILTTALALFASTIRWWARGLLLLVTLAYVVWGLVIHIAWLAGWLPGMFALAFLVWMRSKRLALLLVVVVVGLVAAQWDYAQKAFASEDSESGGTRMAAWAANWSVTKDHLLFGTGPAGYAAYYMSYFPDDAMATHSNYVDLLAQTGIIGFVFGVAIFIRLAWTAYQVVRRVRGRGDFVEALANAALAGTLACILAMGFGDWLFPFAYTQTIAGYDYEVYSWLFMGTALALDRLTRAEGTALPGVVHA